MKTYLLTMLAASTFVQGEDFGPALGELDGSKDDYASA